MPTQASFGQITTADAGQSRKIDIRRGEAPKLDLKLPEQETPGFKAELHTIEPGEHYELEVTLTPPFPESRIYHNLTLETGFEEAPSASIRVFGSYPPHLAANPRYIRIPATRNADWEQTVRLEWDDKAPHKILEATVADPNLKVRVADDKGSEVVILTVPNDYSFESLSSSVTIKTDDTQSPSLSVPVLASKTPRTVTRRAIPRPKDPAPPKVGRTAPSKKPTE